MVDHLHWLAASPAFRISRPGNQRKEDCEATLLHRVRTSRDAYVSAGYAKIPLPVEQNNSAFLHAGEEATASHTQKEDGLKLER